MSSVKNFGNKYFKYLRAEISVSIAKVHEWRRPRADDNQYNPRVSNVPDWLKISMIALSDPDSRKDIRKLLLSRTRQNF